MGGEADQMVAGALEDAVVALKVMKSVSDAASDGGVTAKGSVAVKALLLPFRLGKRLVPGLGAVQKAAEVAALGPAGPFLRRKLWALYKFLNARNPVQDVLDFAKNPTAKLAELHAFCEEHKLPVGAAVALLLHMRMRAHQRAHRVACIQVVRRLNIKERCQLVRSTREKLPSWLTNPNYEEATWLNNMLMKLWPYIANTLQQVLDEYVRDLIEKEMNSHGTEEVFILKLPVLSLGTIAPKFKEVTVVDGGKNDEVLLQMGVEWSGNPKIMVSVKSKFAPKLKVEFKDFQLVGNIQLKLAPLLAQEPYVGGFAFMFMEAPSLRYTLAVKPLPGMPEISLSMIPGLQEFLDSILKIILRDTMVFPKAVVVPIATKEGEDGEQQELGVMEIGRVRVVCDKAKNLPDADWGFISGKSDPYVKLGVGLQGTLPANFKMTKTIDDELNPTWDEMFEFPVHSLTVQELVIEVWDEDNEVTGDELLGSCTVDLSTIVDGKLKKGKWYTLVSPLIDPKNADETPMIFLRIDWDPADYWENVTHGVHNTLKIGSKGNRFCKLVKQMVSRMNLDKKRSVNKISKYSLPAWMSGPDIDSVHWLNDITGILWPFIHELANDFLSFKNKCRSYDPCIPGMEMLLNLDLGQCPNFYVDGVKVLTTSESELIMDLHVNIGGDMTTGAEIRLLKNPLGVTKIELQQLIMSMCVRIHMRPLIATLPYACNASIQVIGDPFLDFKMMVKPSPFLPAVDLASVPGFSMITNFALNKALGATLKYPLNVSVPILDLEDPDVYFHMDLAGKVEGMFCVEVVSITGGNADNMLMSVGSAAKDVLFQSMNASTSLGGLLGTAKLPAVYTMCTTDTRLDTFDVLKKRAYFDKFQRTKGLEKDPRAPDCIWDEELAFLVDSPENVVVTLGVFMENPYTHEKRYGEKPGPAKNDLEALNLEAVELTREVTSKQSILDIPWSYEFWYNVLSDSLDRDPDDPSTWDKKPPVWPGLAKKLEREAELVDDEPDSEDEDEAEEGDGDAAPDTEQKLPPKPATEFLTPSAKPEPITGDTPAQAFVKSAALKKAVSVNGSVNGDVETPQVSSSKLADDKPAISALRENGFLANTAAKPPELDLSKVPANDVDEVKSPLEKLTAAMESFRSTGSFKPLAAANGSAKPAPESTIPEEENEEAKNGEEEKKKNLEDVETSVSKMMTTEITNGSNLLGSTVMKIGAKRNGKKKSHAVPIKAGHLKGCTLNVNVRWRSFKPPEAKDELPENEVLGVLLVRLINISDLVKEATHPRVEITVEGKKKISTVAQGRDPFYNEMLVFAGVEVSPASLPSLQLQVKTNETKIGYLSTSLREVVLEGRQQIESRLLQVHSGVIRLELTWQELAA